MKPAEDLGSQPEQQISPTAHQNDDLKIDSRKCSHHSNQTRPLSEKSAAMDVQMDRPLRTSFQRWRYPSREPGMDPMEVDAGMMDIPQQRSDNVVFPSWIEHGLIID